MRRVEEDRKGNVAAEPGGGPDEDVALLPCRREGAQRLGGGFAIVVVVPGRGLGGLPARSLSDDGRNGGEGAEGQRRGGDDKKRIRRHYHNLVFPCLLAELELERARCRARGQIGGRCGFCLEAAISHVCLGQSAEGARRSCSGNVTLHLPLPDCIMLGPSRFIPPPAPFPTVCRSGLTHWLHKRAGINSPAQVPGAFAGTCKASQKDHDCLKTCRCAARCLISVSSSPNSAGKWGPCDRLWSALSARKFKPEAVKISASQATIALRGGLLRLSSLSQSRGHTQVGDRTVISIKRRHLVIFTHTYTSLIPTAWDWNRRRSRICPIPTRCQAPSWEEKTMNRTRKPLSIPFPIGSFRSDAIFMQQMPSARPSTVCLVS